MEVQFAEKLEPIFQPRRYKVIYGGRGGGRSWGVARYLLLEGASRKIRVLCAREVQKSIRDSVHRLLCDQIEHLGLGSFYETLDTEIRGLNGTLFIFAGLSNQTAESIKSYEGVDKVWCEEAQSVSKRSWDILIPTIRADGSEVIVTFNPELDTDETYKRYVVNTPPDTWLCELNWRDNPWFPEVLEQERLHCQLTSPDDYDTIWEGKCRSAVVGAIYARELESAIREGRVGVCPYDPHLKVHTVWDLGWNDAMSICLVQKVRSEIRFIDYIEDSHKTLDWYAAELNTRRYNWGYDYLPHDGDTRDFKTGMSAAEILRRFGRKVRITPNMPVESGIKATRMMLGQSIFDKAKCERLLECLKRYRRNQNQRTEEFGAPLHDEYSHACLSGESLVNTKRGLVAIKDVVVEDYVWTPCGWSKVINAGIVKYTDVLVEISLSDGRSLKCTHDHKILTSNGFVVADSLRYNNNVFNGMEWQCRVIKYISMVIGIGFRKTITGEAEEKGLGSCIGLYGKKSMGIFLPVMSYITKITTRAITQFRTWNASQSKIITNIILRIFGRKLKQTQLSIKKLLIRTLNGEDRQKEGPSLARSTQRIDQRENIVELTYQHSMLAGTDGLSPLSTPNFKENTQKDLSLKESSSLLLTNAGPRPQSGTNQKRGGFGIVSRQKNRGEGGKRQSAFVRSAARVICRIVLLAPSTATKIVKLRLCEEEEKIPVYDLTVENHGCYQANGIMVSNCDAARYVAVNASTFTNEDEDDYAPVQRFRPSVSGMGY